MWRDKDKNVLLFFLVVWRKWIKEDVVNELMQITSRLLQGTWWKIFNVQLTTDHRPHWCPSRCPLFSYLTLSLFIITWRGYHIFCVGHNPLDSVLCGLMTIAQKERNRCHTGGNGDQPLFHLCKNISFSNHFREIQRMPNFTLKIC